MRITFSALIVFLFFNIISAQNPEYSSLIIPDSLKQNANAVVRLDQTDIIISSGVSFCIKKKRIVTIFNDHGFSAIEACENYDKTTTRVKRIKATVLDSTGNEIKKFKRKDFRDRTNRIRRLNPDGRFICLNNTTPFKYPYTVIYESELDTYTNIVAHIPQWIPFFRCMLSIEKSILNVSYPENIGFKKMEFNFPNAKISKTIESSTKLSYMVTNMPAAISKNFYQNSNDPFPRVLMLLKYF